MSDGPSPKLAVSDILPLAYHLPPLDSQPNPVPTPTSPQPIEATSPTTSPNRLTVPTSTTGCQNCFSLQQKYIAALESIATLNHRITTLFEEKAAWVDEKAGFQNQVFQLHHSQQFAQQVQITQQVRQQQASQQQQLLQQQQQITQLQHQPNDGSLPDGSVPSGSGQVAQPIAGPSNHHHLIGHNRYAPSLPLSIPEDRLEVARKQYGDYDPFKDLTAEELNEIHSVTPNWTIDHQTRKAIWSELTNRHGIPVMRKIEPGEDPKEYSLERQKSAEWSQISQVARSIARELFVPGRTWFDQTDEAQKLAIKACQMKVEQTRWCENNWKAVVLLDSRLVEWNRAWRDKNEDLIEVMDDGRGMKGRRKRRRQTNKVELVGMSEMDGQGGAGPDGPGGEDMEMDPIEDHM